MKNVLIASLAAVAWIAALPASAGENLTPGGVAQVTDSDGVNQQEAGVFGSNASAAYAPAPMGKATPDTDDGGVDISESNAVSPDFSGPGEVDVMTTGTDPKGD